MELILARPPSNFGLFFCQSPYSIYFGSGGGAGGTRRKEKVKIFIQLRRRDDQVRVATRKKKIWQPKVILSA